MIFKNFLNIKNNKTIKKDFLNLLKNQPPFFETLKPTYKYCYSKKAISKYKKFSRIRVIGMGGSTLGTEAIYNFFKKKIKKKITFVNNLNSNADYFKDKNINLNLIISKSGNTLETIANVNTLIKSKENNIIVTENKDSYLTNLASQLKAEIFEHKNYVGGRYSVLSEVGMLPAELMNLNENKFKQFNSLIKNKTFVNNLVNNVAATLNLIKSGKYTSIILNYDEQSENLFKWYQQLIAESLGKKSKGILPIVSSMPKDNHSLMQLYLDGPKKSFYTFFNVSDNKVIKIDNNNILSSHRYLRNQSIEKIKQSQMFATEKVFKSKKIPFRSFRVLKRDEKSLGELFCFFILETILLGRALKVNPFDQPSVELIKKETKKILTYDITKNNF
ncbi:glucose-6-phosphate isomerase [Candidatus Pelagibacter sp.]|nr:glucose-6-phosphate isomerase [Candidatus Pelagibacter sp.]|tara:strand:+ start:347 stop:1513 length:1167 start_codon:yes stop_codon:yes gene_type:complete